MRISTRLIINAASSYFRLGVTFLIGIFFVWYVTGEVGAAGLGAVLLTTGTFGVAAVLDISFQTSLGREMAAALGSERPERVHCTLVSSMVFAVLASLVVTGIFGVFVVLAMFGLFTRHSEEAGLDGAFAALVAASGAVSVARLLLSPYSVALHAYQRIGLDNALLILSRVSPVLAAVLSFSVIRPEGTLAERLYVFAIVRTLLGIFVAGIPPLVARFVVPHMQFKREAFSRDELRQVAQAAWQTAQYTLGTSLMPHVLALLINLMFGLAANGLWGVVQRVGGHAKMAGEALLHGVFPMAAQMHAQGRSEAIANLVTHAMRYQLAVAMPIVACYVILLPPILDLWIGHHLQTDPTLGETGWTVTEAMRLTVSMSVFALLAELFRASTRGVERMLFGMGRVKSYAWFSKWSVLIITSLGGVMMWFFDSPLPAAVVLMVVVFFYSDVIILRAARRHVDITVASLLRTALPRPAVLTVLMCVPALIARLMLPHLTLSSLLALLAGIGVVYVPLALFVVLDRGERARFFETFMGAAARLRAAVRPGPST